MRARFRSSAASPLLGIVLAAVAFGARGGTELGRTTVVEIALLLAGGAIVAYGVWRGPPGRLRGAAAVALLAALALLTTLSVTWSVAPDASWVEANRILAYLAVFAAAVCAARLAPDSWRAVLGGVLIGAAAVTAWALLSRVFPGSLAEDDVYARIGQPYDYWNAVGVTAALAVPASLWLATRRDVDRRVAALAFPLLGLIAVALLLTYSRASLLAALVGAGLWVAIVPWRLRSLAAFAIPAVAATPLIVWALSQDAFTEDFVDTSVREDGAGIFGVLLLVLAGVLYAAGWLYLREADRRPIAPAVRRRIATAAVVLVAIAPVAAAVALATTERGLLGSLSDRVESLASTEAGAPGGPERLTTTSSSRGRYWGQAMDVFADDPVIGAGAGAFSQARLRHREDRLVARHAHGFVPQTMADLGLAGLIVSLALLAAWLASTARTTRLGREQIAGLARRADAGSFDSTRAGLVALALVAVTFGLQSTLDWTWFVPGPAVMALVAAGFVAGRGPAGEAEPAAAPTTELAAGADAPPASAPFSRRARALLAGGIALTALLAAWAAWQPERANDLADDALALVEEGDAQAAIDKARDAADVNPLALRPLIVQAHAEEAAGRTDAASRTLRRAVRRHRSDPQAWLRLANFELDVRDDPGAALQALRGAFYLDPRSPAAAQTFRAARARIVEQVTAGQRGQ